MDFLEVLRQLDKASVTYTLENCYNNECSLSDLLETLDFSKRPVRTAYNNAQKNPVFRMLLSEEFGNNPFDTTCFFYTMGLGNCDPKLLEWCASATAKQTRFLWKLGVFSDLEVYQARLLTDTPTGDMTVNISCIQREITTNKCRLDDRELLLRWRDAYDKFVDSVSPERLKPFNKFAELWSWLESDMSQSYVEMQYPLDHIDLRTLVNGVSVREFAAISDKLEDDQESWLSWVQEHLNITLNAYEAYERGDDMITCDKWGASGLDKCRLQTSVVLSKQRVEYVSHGLKMVLLLYGKALSKRAKDKDRIRVFKAFLERNASLYSKLFKVSDLISDIDKTGGISAGSFAINNCMPNSRREMSAEEEMRALFDTLFTILMYY